MVSVIHFVFAVVSIAAKLVAAQDSKIGGACVLEESGDAGLCVSLKDCNPAKMGLRFGKPPQMCLHEGNVSVVCCDITQTSFVQPTTNGTTPAAYLARNSRAAKYTTQVCPDKPPEAVTVQKRGQKAWDKCIDLSDSVYPCAPSSNLHYAPLERGYECAYTGTSLIVGGEIADEGEFPHMAAVGYGDSRFPAAISWNCGGSLISELWVLTAGHCLTTREKRPASHVRLGGGDNDIPPTRENLYTVIRSLKHPRYVRPIKYNDIGLLQLDRKVSFSSEIRPACLHTGDPVIDEIALVTGWGTTRSNGAMSKSLLKTTVQKFAFEECQQTHEPTKGTFMHGVLNDTMICYGHRTLKQDTCTGDSGGPLQIYNKERVDCTYLIIGVTSNGKICGKPGYPAIYTRISAFISWIEENVWPDD